MTRLRFKSSRLSGAVYLILGGALLALGWVEHHGLARWERVSLGLLMLVAGACHFIGVQRRRTP